MTTLANPETSLEDRLCNIETILTDAETFRGMAQQHEYTKRTNKLIEEVKTTLLDIEATHGFDIALWDYLHNAIYNLDMIEMMPYKPRLDTHKHDLPNLTRGLRNRIQSTEHQLQRMSLPIQNPAQRKIYSKYIERLQELTIQAHTDAYENRKHKGHLPHRD